MNEIRIIQRHNPLPGIKLLEYLINDELNEITINIDDVEVKNITGDYGELLSHLEKTKMIDLPHVINRKCIKTFGKSIDQLSEKTRKRDEYVYPRQIAMYWARLNSDVSLTFIGSMFKLNHATVINSVKSIDSLLSYDKQVEEMYKQFCNA